MRLKRNKGSAMPTQIGIVSHISFSPVHPHDYAVTSSTRVRAASRFVMSVTMLVLHLQHQQHCLAPDSKP
jgi:hypothetical protein